MNLYLAIKETQHRKNLQLKISTHECFEVQRIETILQFCSVVYREPPNPTFHPLLNSSSLRSFIASQKFKCRFVFASRLLSLLSRGEMWFVHCFRPLLFSTLTSNGTHRRIPYQQMFDSFALRTITATPIEAIYYAIKRPMRPSQVRRNHSGRVKACRRGGRGCEAGASSARPRPTNPIWIAPGFGASNKNLL